MNAGVGFGLLGGFGRDLRLRLGGALWSSGLGQTMPVPSKVARVSLGFTRARAVRSRGAQTEE